MATASWQPPPTPTFDWAEKAALWARMNSDDGWAGRQRPGGATSVRQLPRGGPTGMRGLHKSWPVRYIE